MTEVDYVKAVCEGALKGLINGAELVADMLVFDGKGLNDTFGLTDHKKNRICAIYGITDYFFEGDADCVYLRLKLCWKGRNTYTPHHLITEKNKKPTNPIKLEKFIEFMKCLYEQNDLENRL